MQVNFRMHRQEVATCSVLWVEMVVSDHMDLFAARLIDHDVRKERDEFGRGVPLCVLPSTSPVLVLNAA